MGIPIGFLWEWELKFYSHGNPGIHCINECTIGKQWLQNQDGLVENFQISNPANHRTEKHDLI